MRIVVLAGMYWMLFDVFLMITAALWSTAFLLCGDRNFIEAGHRSATLTAKFLGSPGSFLMIAVKPRISKYSWDKQ